MVQEDVRENPDFRIVRGGPDFDIEKYRSDLGMLWESRFIGCFNSSDRSNPAFTDDAKRYFFESFKNPRVTIVLDGDRLVACGGWQFDGYKDIG